MSEKMVQVRYRKSGFITERKESTALRLSDKGIAEIIELSEPRPVNMKEDNSIDEKPSVEQKVDNREPEEKNPHTGKPIVEEPKTAAPVQQQNKQNFTNRK